MGAPFAGSWGVAFNTDDPAFGGDGRGDKAPIKTEKIPCHDQQQSFTADLPPMSAVIYRCVRKNPIRKSEKASVNAEEKPTKVKKAPAKKAEKAGAVPAAEEAPKKRTRKPKSEPAEKPKRTRAKKAEK